MLSYVIGNLSYLLQFFLQLASIQTETVLSLEHDDLFNDLLELSARGLVGELPIVAIHALVVEADVLTRAVLLGGHQGVAAARLLGLAVAHLRNSVVPTGVLYAGY